MPDLATYSPLDSTRFGKRIYRANARHVDDAQSLDEQANREHIDMIICRCATSASDVVHALEARQHRLMDTLVYYRGAARSFQHATWAHEIRRAVPADGPALQALANDAFTGYDGHYHADPRLDGRLATLGYVEWCLSLLGRDDHDVLVTFSEGQLAGFLAVHHQESISDIVLNGVARPFQRQGIYASLVKSAGRTAFESGRERVMSSTHVGNVSPQKVWARNGMALVDSVYTFHKWFDP
jgi:RimJ/RimL family protein N-acetyltransferase